MAKKTVLITGASGNVGKASLASLGAFSEILDVKAGVRDPAKPDSAALASIAPNVTVVAADPTGGNLVSALKGVDYLYIVTPGSSNRAKVAVSAIKAGKEAGVKFVLLISVLTTPRLESVFGKQFTEIEKVISESGLNYTILRLPFFFENNFGQLDPIKHQGAIYGPSIPDKPLTSVSVGDIADVAAKVLSNPEPHIGQTYRLTAPLYTNAELAKAFSDALEKPVNYIQVPYEAAKASMIQLGMEEWQVDGVNELNQMVDTSDEVYVDVSAVGTIDKILGRPATTIQEWVKQVAPAFK